MKWRLSILFCLALAQIAVGQNRFRMESTDADHQWAVLICGNQVGNGAEHRFWFDLSSVYSALANVWGYQESEIFDFQNRRIVVLAPSQIRDEYKDDFDYNTTADLNGNNSYNGDFFYCEDYLTLHTKENIHNVFKCFAGDAQCVAEYQQYGLRELTEEDHLFVFMTGHGHRDKSLGASYFEVNEDIGNDTPRVYDFEFTEWLREIDCGQMTLMSQICYAGGFVEAFMTDIYNSRCQNRIAQSATSAEEVSHAEVHSVYANSPSVLNGMAVNEFTYYWTAAVLGYYPKYQFGDGINGTIVVEGPWTESGRGIGDGTMNWETYFGSFESIHPHGLYDVDPDTNGDGYISYGELFDFANNLDTWSRQGYYHPNKNDTLYEGFEPECPQYRHEDLTSIGETTMVEEVSVCPNPTTDWVRIDGDEVAEVKVYNSYGQMVRRFKASNNINLEELPTGIYTLQILGKGGGRNVCRMVKE